MVFYVYYILFICINLVDVMSLFFTVFHSIYRFSAKIDRFSEKKSKNRRFSKKPIDLSIKPACFEFSLFFHWLRCFSTKFSSTEFSNTEPESDLPFRPRRRELNPTRQSGHRLFPHRPDLLSPHELRRALPASLPRDRHPSYIYLSICPASRRCAHQIQSSQRIYLFGYLLPRLTNPRRGRPWTLRPTGGSATSACIIAWARVPEARRRRPTGRSATTGAKGGAIASPAPSFIVSCPRRRRRPSAAMGPGGTSGATPTLLDEEAAPVVAMIDGGRAAGAAAAARATSRQTGPVSTSSPGIATTGRGAAIPTATT
jgi:hypothetical protein